MSDLTYTVKAEGVKDVEALTRSLESLHKVLDSGKGSGKALEEVRKLIVGFKGQASVFEEMRNSMQSMQQTMADMSNKMPAVVRMMTRGIAQEMKVVVATMRTDGAAAGKAYSEGMTAELSKGSTVVVSAAKESITGLAKEQVAGIRTATSTAKAALAGHYDSLGMFISSSESKLAAETAKRSGLSAALAAGVGGVAAATKQVIQQVAGHYDALGRFISAKELETNKKLEETAAIRRSLLAKLGSQATPDTGLRIYTQKVNEDIASLNAAYKKLEETANLKDRIRARLGAGSPADTGRLLQGSSQQTSLAASRAFDYGSKDYTKGMDDLRKAYSEIETKQASVAKSSETLGSAFKKLTIDGNDMHSMARGLASGFNLLWLTWGNLVPLFAGAGISFGVKKTFDIGSEVEYSIKQMEILGQVTSSQGTIIRQALRDIDQTTMFSLTELSSAMVRLGQAGKTPAESLQMLRPAADLASAGMVDLNTSTDLLIQTQALFGKSAADTAKMAAQIFQITKSGVLNVEDIAGSMKYASEANTRFGKSLEETLAILGSLASAGLKGSSGGTAYINFLRDINGRSGPAVEAMKTLGDLTGKTIKVFDELGNQRSAIDIFNDIAEASKKLKNEDADKLLAKIFSDRGGRTFFAMVRDGTIDLQKMVDELKQVDPQTLFMAAKGLMDTTKGALDILKGTLVGALDQVFEANSGRFKAFIIDLTRAIDSPEFKTSVANIVDGVLSIYEAIKATMPYVIAFGTAWAAFKAASIGVTVFQAIAGSLAAMAPLLSQSITQTVVYTAATLGSASATATSTTAAAAQGTAMIVQAAAARGAAAGMTALEISTQAATIKAVAATGVMRTLAIVAGFLSNPLVGIITTLGLLGLAWWQMSSDAEGSMNTVTGAVIKNGKVNLDQWDKEIQKLRDRNKLLGDGKYANFESTIATAEAEQMKLNQDRKQAEKDFMTAKTAGMRQASNTALELIDKEYSANQKNINKMKLDLSKLRAEDAARVDDEQRKARAKSLVTPQGSITVPPTGGSGKGTSTPGNSLKQELYTEQKALTEITKARDAELANKKRNYDLQKQLLDNKNKNELISRTEYAIQVAAQTDAFEEEQLKSLTEYNDKYQAQSLKAIAELQRNEELYRKAGNKDRADNFASLAETQREAAVRVAKDTAEKVTNIQQEAATRNQIIIQDMAGEASKLLKADDKVWKDRRDKLNAAKDLEAINLQYKYLNTSVFSAAEGEKAYVMAMAETMSSVRAQNKTLEEFADHLQAVADAQYAIIMTKDYTGQEDGMSEADLARLQKLLTAKEAVAKLRQRIASNTEQGFIQGAEEGALAMAKVMQEKRDALVNGVSNAIETAVFEGGSAGGKAMRQYLQDELLRKPFRAFVQTTVSYLLNGVLGSVGGAAVSSIAGGAANSVLGSVGTSLATSAGLSVTGMTGLGTALGEGFMSTVSGLFTGGAPVTSMGMGAAGAAFNVGAALPFVGAGLVVANALGLFRKTTTTDVGIKGTLGYQSDLSAFTTKRKSGTLFSGPSYWDELASLGDKQNEAIDNSVKSVYSAVEASAKALGLNAEAIRDFTQEIFVSTKDLTEEQVQAKLSAEFTKLGDNLAALVLPTAAYAKSNETASQTLSRLASSLTTVNTIFRNIGAALYDVSVQGADAASKLADAFGGLEAMQAAFSSYYDKYYSAEEKRANVLRDVTEALKAAGANVSVSQISKLTTSGFREIYETVSRLYGAESAIAVTMIKVSSAFYDAQSSADSASTSVGSFADNLKAAFDKLKASAAALKVAGQLRDTISMKLGGGAGYAAGRESTLWSALGKGTPSQQIQVAQELYDLILSRDALEKEQAATAMEAVKLQIDANNELIDATKSQLEWAKSLKEYVDSLLIGSVSPLTTAEKLAEASRQYSETLAKANSGDTTAQGNLQGAASAYLDLARTYYASSDQYSAIFDSVVTSLKNLSSNTLTEAGKTLAALESQTLIMQQQYEAATNSNELSQASKESLAKLLESVDSAYAQLEAQFQQDKLDADAALTAAQEAAARLGRLDDIAALLADLPGELAALFNNGMAKYTESMLVSILRETRKTTDLSVGMNTIRDTTAANTKAPIADVTAASTKLYSDLEILRAYQVTKATYPTVSDAVIAEVAYRNYGITQEQFNKVISGSHRDGLDYVPYDGYVAELHRGERVLTQAEASNYNGMSYGEVVQLLAEVVGELQELRAEAKTNARMQAGAIMEGSDRVVQGVVGTQNKSQRKEALAERSYTT